MGFWEVAVLRKRAFHPDEPFLRKWNKIFAVLILVAPFLDLLFLYDLGIDNQRKCLRLDVNLENVALILRLIVDSFLLIRVFFRLHTGFVVLSTRKNSFSPLPVEDFREIARRYIFPNFLIDILAIVPLLQVAVLLIIPKMEGSRILNRIYLLKFIVALQLVPKIFQCYDLYRESQRGSHKQSRYALFILFLSFLAAHVIGAFWYLFSLEREMDCWQGACASHASCNSEILYCSGYSGNELDKRDSRFLDIACPAASEGRSSFNYGAFIDGHNSRILESSSLLHKLFYCSWWALGSLSTFGENLKASTQIWELCFTLCISTGGLVFCAFVIDFIQSTLMKQAKRREWRKPKGVHVENLLHNLPKPLESDIKRHLCRNLLLKVPMFEIMGAQLLDATCDFLKPVLYKEESYIVREGDPVNKMLFITQGKLQTVRNNGGRTGISNPEYLNAGDFSGEELITWALDPHSSINLPISTKTVQTLTEVEGFVLVANDLKSVASQFCRLHRKQIQRIYRFCSQQWRTWAACLIQTAWWRYTKKKQKDELAKTRRDFSSLVSSQFAAIGHGIFQHSGARKVRLKERAPPVLLQKPAEPDFASNER